MNRRYFTILISLLLVLLLSLPLSAFAVTQSDIDRLQTERDELAEKQRQSQEKIEQLKEEQASVIEQKKALDERNAIAAEQLSLIQEQIELYHQMIEEKALEVEKAQEIEDEQLRRLRVRVRAMEENGGYDILSLLIHVDSFSELLSAMDDIGQIMEADRMLEDEYIAARQFHEEQKSEYEALLSELEEREDELIRERDELDQMIREASDLIASLDENIEQAKLEYEEAERQKEAADQKISQLTEELSRQRKKAEEKKPAPTEAPAESDSPDESQTQTDSGPSDESQSETGSDSSDESQTGSPSDPGDDPPESGTVGTGSLVWPVPCSHRVTSRFGYRIHPVTGEEKYHSGIDIDGYGNDGGAIIACDSGVVVMAEYSGGYGNCVVIDHGNGMQTLYGHMSGFAVSAGDSVTQGQTIGYLGSTGMSTGTHCHLEVRINGGQVDPAGYFSGIEYYDC